MVVLCAAAKGATTAEDFATAHAAALSATPPEIRSLSCADFLADEDTPETAVHKWFDGLMAPAIKAGFPRNQIYAQLTRECVEEPGRKVLDAAVGLLDFLRPP